MCRCGVYSIVLVRTVVGGRRCVFIRWRAGLRASCLSLQFRDGCVLLCLSKINTKRTALSLFTLSLRRPIIHIRHNVGGERRDIDIARCCRLRRRLHTVAPHDHRLVQPRISARVAQRRYVPAVDDLRRL